MDADLEVDINVVMDVDVSRRDATRRVASRHINIHDNIDVDFEVSIHNHIDNASSSLMSSSPWARRPEIDSIDRAVGRSIRSIR